MDRAKTLKARIVAACRLRILTGAYAPGAQLPRVPELCREFDASVTTVVTALRELQQLGYVSPRATSPAQAGLGYFARRVPPVDRLDADELLAAAELLREEARRLERLAGRMTGRVSEIDGPAAS